MRVGPQLKPCEIPGCGHTVMGCEADDECRATRLCERHYFLIVVIAQTEDCLLSRRIATKIFGLPSVADREKMRQWYARWQAEENS